MKSTGKSRTIYVHEEDYEYLHQIGGSYAEGLRRAVQAHRDAYADSSAAACAGDDLNQKQCQR